MLFCCLTHNCDESSLRSEALSTSRSPDHKQVRSHLPTSPSVCQRWRQSAVSAVSPESLENLERWRLIDELRESSNMAQPPVSEPRLCQTAESACLLCSPTRLHIQALAHLVNGDWLVWWHSAVNKCVVTQGQCNLELSHQPVKVCWNWKLYWWICTYFLLQDIIFSDWFESLMISTMLGSALASLVRLCSAAKKVYILMLNFNIDSTLFMSKSTITAKANKIFQKKGINHPMQF